MSVATLVESFFHFFSELRASRTIPKMARDVKFIAGIVCQQKNRSTGVVRRARETVIVCAYTD
jgi:hypothetical protein